MSLLKRGRRILESMPVVDVFFRRAIWSRTHFPESEMRAIAALKGRPIDVAIDVGAATGGYAWLLNRKSRRVIAFEPGREHSRRIEIGRIGTRIELERKAVGAQAGTLPLYTPGDDVDALHSATLSTSNPVVLTETAQIENVEVVTLDNYCDANLSATERVDFLKVDVEGFEDEVIAGAEARIANDLPVILCEIEARHNADYRDVFRRLAALGYSAYYKDGASLKPPPDEGIEPLQTEAELAYRISPDYRPGTSRYFNNFLFIHPDSRLSLT